MSALKQRTPKPGDKLWLVFWADGGGREDCSVYNCYIATAETKDEALRLAATHYFSDEEAPTETDVLEYIETLEATEMNYDDLRNFGVVYSW